MLQLLSRSRSPDTKKQKAVLAMKNRKKYRNTRTTSLYIGVACSNTISPNNSQNNPRREVHVRGVKHTQGAVKKGAEGRGGQGNGGGGKVKNAAAKAAEMRPLSSAKGKHTRRNMEIPLHCTYTSVTRTKGKKNHSK